MMMPGFSIQMKFIVKSRGDASPIEPWRMEISSINVEQGQFMGNTGRAQAAIQTFIDANNVYCDYHGRGYGTIYVNGVAHGTNPYGIDISTMLDLCNIDASTLQARTAPGTRLTATLNGELIAYCRGGNLATVIDLVHQGANINAQVPVDTDSHTPLFRIPAASDTLSNPDRFSPAPEGRAKKIVVQRDSDKLTTVTVDNMATITARAVGSAAVADALPDYTPDGCGAILLFHTPDHKIHGLGGLRANPALKDKVTTDGTPYPLQVNTTIGGKLFNPDEPLQISIRNAIMFKMFFDPNTSVDSPIYSAQQVIKSLMNAIAAPEGWGHDVCVHTDSWSNGDGLPVGTMCFLTTVKHIQCETDDLQKIQDALQVVMAYKKTQDENPRNLSDFKFYPFVNTMRCATRDALIKRTEVEKAAIAYAAQVPATFNDLALKVLRDNHAYQTSTGSVVLRLEGDEPTQSPSRN